MNAPTPQEMIIQQLIESLNLDGNPNLKQLLAKSLAEAQKEPDDASVSKESLPLQLPAREQCVATD